jgi:GTP cyclohydrolase-4
MKGTSDVQKRLPLIRLSLGRVGVVNVRKLIRIPRKEKRPIILLVDFHCFVDLPSFQKGIHMSRNLEAINEVLEEVVKDPVYELEALCQDIVQKVLQKHEYAQKCEVEMESQYMVYGKTPVGRRSQDFIKLLAKATARRGERPVETEVGAEIQGVILHHDRGRPGGTPPGPVQKATASLVLTVPEGRFVKIEEIVRILERTLGSRVTSYLDEEEEEEVLAEIRRSPRDVSGVVTAILQGVRERFGDLPPDTKVHARCEAIEPLFPYTPFAERTALLGDLKFP